MGKKPDGCKPGTSRKRAGPSVRSPARASVRDPSPMDETYLRARPSHPLAPFPAWRPSPLTCRPVGQPAHAPAAGAEAYVFHGQIWVRVRVAVVIHRTDGVGYHPAHVSALLNDSQWGLQMPARRARQCDEARMAQWQQGTWLALKKGHRSSSSPVRQREAWVLCPAKRRPHLCPGRVHAHSEGVVGPRSPLRHRSHLARGHAVAPSMRRMWSTFWNISCVSCPAA